MKTELILEGGGMRSVYTAGVLDFFLDKQIIFKDIVAVSAGVGVATSYISGQRGRTLDIFEKYSQDKRYLGFRSFIKTGSLFGMKFIFKTIPDKLLPFAYNEYIQANVNLYAVCSDLKEGKGLYKKIDDVKKDLKYIMGSSSLPMISKIIKVDDYKLLDGGVVDPIPIDYSINKGMTNQVIVLTRNEGYRKTRSKATKIVAKRFFRYPNFMKALLNRYRVYNNSLDKIDELLQENKVIVIRPTKPMLIDRYEKDKNKLQEVYNMGYNDAKNSYNKIKELANICDNVTIGKNV